MIYVVIDLSISEPLYGQIVRQIRAGVATGHLAPGEPLPPVRQLAEDLDLNRNTVARAYRILEGQRVVTTARGKGTFVHENAPSEVALSRAARLRDEVRVTIDALAAEGASPNEILDAVTRELANR